MPGNSIVNSLPYLAALPTLISALYAHQQMQSNPGYDYYPLASPFGTIPLAPFDLSSQMMPEDIYANTRNLTSDSKVTAGWNPISSGRFGLWSQGYVQGGRDDNSPPIHNMNYGFDFGNIHQQLGSTSQPVPQLQAPALAKPENMGQYYHDQNNNPGQAFWDHLTGNYPKPSDYFSGVT